MSQHDNSEDFTWPSRLKRDAASQLPPFSPSLHNRIIQKALYRTSRTDSVERTTHRWFFRTSVVCSSLATAVIILLLGISIWTHLQPPPMPESTPAAAEINISALFPDSGRLIEQTATHWQVQFSKQTLADLQSQMQQLTRYVVRKISFTDPSNKMLNAVSGDTDDRLRH